MNSTDKINNPLQKLIQKRIEAAGGRIGFDQFMAMALYTPQLGYYANSLRKFGKMASSGSDFVTAPELSPWFGRSLANALNQALDETEVTDIWEFGAGSGALAEQILETLGNRIRHYRIVDLSGSLRQRQQQRLAKFASQVGWLDELPETFKGVVIGNELIDAMPVQLLARINGQWHERGVSTKIDPSVRFCWQDHPTELRPPVEIAGNHDYLTEIHPQADAFINTLSDRLEQGAVFLIDYGFPESEYYHPQRHMGTLMCHQGHLADTNPLDQVGFKDITAHVNFTSLALTAQNAGMQVLGYTSQAHFLINCGLLNLLENATLAERAMAQKLIMEHEMGEFFKVLALGVGTAWEPTGFKQGDRSHTL
jgi:SAM-dependent MidA family methyltransferase